MTPVANTSGIVSYAGASTLMWTDSGLSNGSEYFYTVKALTGCAEGEASNESSDIVDPTGIPWDTRDPQQILSVASDIINADTPSGLPLIDIDDEFEVTGPDGANYQRGIATQQPPTLLYDAATGGYALPDGTPFALSSDDLDDSQQFQGNSASSDIRPMEIGGPVRGGAYRGAITPTGYRAVSFRVLLGNVYVSPYGKTAHTDHPVVYLGSSVKDPHKSGGVDAGMMFGASADNRWHLYFRAFVGRYIVTYSNITFAPNTEVNMSYFLAIRGKTMLASLKIQDLTEDGRVAHKAIPIKNHNFDFSNVQVKRNQQLAEVEKGSDGKATKIQIRGVNIEKTGSYMVGFNWMSGYVWKSTEGLGHLWGIPDTAAITSWTGSGAATVTFDEQTRFRDSFETGVGVDLR